MRMNKLLIALAASSFLSAGAAVATQDMQGQELPEFDQVDIDGDGAITQEEAQAYPSLEQEMEGEEMTREDYEDVREEQGMGAEGSGTTESGGAGAGGMTGDDAGDTSDGMTDDDAGGATGGGAGGASQ